MAYSKCLNVLLFWFVKVYETGRLYVQKNILFKKMATVSMLTMESVQQFLVVVSEIINSSFYFLMKTFPVSASDAAL